MLKDLIMDEIDDLPGQVMKCSQPIEQRVNEMSSGVKGAIAIKVFGKDLDELSRLSKDIERVLKEVNAKAEVSMEQLIGAPTLEIKDNLPAMAKHNLLARTVLDYVEALGSKPAGEILTQQQRFPLVIRLAEQWRTKEAVAKIPIPTPSGGTVTLGEVTTIRQVEGPAGISREWSKRRTVIQCNIESDDITGFVDAARKRIDKEVSLPKTATIASNGAAPTNIWKPRSSACGSSCRSPWRRFSPCFISPSTTSATPCAFTWACPSP